MTTKGLPACLHNIVMVLLRLLTEGLLRLTKGLLVLTKGLLVLTKGLVVLTKGLVVLTKGLLVLTKGLLVLTKGLLVLTKGLVVLTKGLLVLTKGLLVLAKGLLVLTKGLLVLTKGLLATLRYLISAPANVCAPSSQIIALHILVCPEALFPFFYLRFLLFCHWRMQCISHCAPTTLPLVLRRPVVHPPRLLPKNQNGPADFCDALSSKETCAQTCTWSVTCPDSKQPRAHAARNTTVWSVDELCATRG
jgi:hypothetical protein